MFNRIDFIRFTGALSAGLGLKPYQHGSTNNVSTTKGTPAMNVASSDQVQNEVTRISSDSASIVGEPLAYPSSPNPEIRSAILTLDPGKVTSWMTHPVPPYIYVLEGTLTIEFAEDGSRKQYHAGQAFLQARAKWHRGRNDANDRMRFLAVFCGAKDVPVILHPPVEQVAQRATSDFES